MRDRLQEIRHELIDNCAICDGAGYIKKDGDALDCECHKKYATYVRLKLTGVDEEYWDLTIDDWQSDQKAKQEILSYISNLENAYKNGLSLCLSGPHGTGKTLGSIIILKEAQKKYKTFFITLAELLDEVKKSFDKQHDELDEFHQWYDKVKSADFLVLDDLGGEYAPSDFGKYAASQCDLLFRFRRRNNLPTILTTNLTQEEFLVRYGSALKSIINSRFKIIVVSGQDYRFKQGKQWNTLLMGE